MNGVLINVDNISFAYPEGHEVISDFSYSFYEKQSYIICGENGCGKTTITRLLLGLLTPDKGKIERKSNIVVSYVPDDNGVYENLSVRDNVLFRLGIYNKKFKDVEEKYNNWVKKFKLSLYAGSLVGDLSLGTKKKVALLCAMLVMPDVIVLDEPTGGLDISAQKELIKMLEMIKNDTVIITVTHDDFYIKNFKSEMIYLENNL